MANAGTINSKLIKAGITMLRKNKKNWIILLSPPQFIICEGPIRARKLSKEGILEPFIPFNRYIKKNKN